MKKTYEAPELDLIMFRLSRDILGDSHPEPSETTYYNDPDIEPGFD